MNLKIMMFFFDPPYIPEAFNTFLLRAIESSLGSGSNFKRKKPEFLSPKFYLMSYGYTQANFMLVKEVALLMNSKNKG